MQSDDSDALNRCVRYGEAGQYNLSAATLALDQDWTAWLVHCIPA